MDPLEGYSELQQLRERDFSTSFPSMEAMFSNVLHSNGAMMQAAILMFISLCVRFSELTVS